VHAILQVCVQWLQFVPPWLTSRQTHRQTLHLIYDKLSQLSTTLNRLRQNENVIIISSAVLNNSWP